MNVGADPCVCHCLGYRISRRGRTHGFAPTETFLPVGEVAKHLDRKTDERPRGKPAMTPAQKVTEVTPKNILLRQEMKSAVPAVPFCKHNIPRHRSSYVITITEKCMSKTDLTENISQPTDLVVQNNIQSKILVIRGQQVMIDRDIAAQYGVETKRLKEQVKRNRERFPEEFCFQIDDLEKSELVANCDRFNVLKHSSVNPYAFTEQGVAMLSAVLKSATAVKVSVQIMNAFVEMRKFMLSNAQVFAEINSLKQHFIESDIHQKETDKRVDELFTLMDKYGIDETQGIFFQGQIFDAYAKFDSFIKRAKNEIVLIDNYVDISVLERFAKKAKSAKVSIYTDPKTKLTAQDIRKFNEQYPTLEVHFTNKVHDRFLIIDGEILYHIGASLKDLGKKCFAFEILDPSFIKIILDKI